MLSQAKGNTYNLNETYTSIVNGRLLRRSRLGSSSTIAQQRRSSHVADYAKGLGALVSSKRIPEAVSLLEGFLEQKRRLHALSTGDLLEALCDEGRHETAWQLIRRLSASNNRLPLKVLHRLLKAAGQFGTVDDVLAVYEHQQQLYGFASMGVQTTLIHALLKAHGRGKPGNLLAYEAWGRMKGSGCQLDTQALLAGMHACVCVRRLQEAEALLEPLRERAGAVSRPVVSGHNLLMKAHAQAANPDAARKLFVAMKARGLVPDAVTYNTLLCAFVSAGEVLRGKAVLDKMQREGVSPDAWSYTTLLLGLGQAGQLGELQQVLRDMTGAGLAPNEATYAAIIKAYVAAGDMPAAHAMMQQLLDQQQAQQQPVASQQQAQQGQKKQKKKQKQLAPEQQPSQLVEQQRLPAVAAAAADAAGVAAKPSRRVLRQLYNTLIKGHLQLSGAAAAAAAAENGVSAAGIRIGSAAGALDGRLDEWDLGAFQQQQQQLQQQASVQAARLAEVASAAGRMAVDQPAAAAGLLPPSAAAAAADLEVVESAEAAAAAAVADFRALGYQASAAAAAAAAGWHVSGYQAALTVLDEMAAAGVAPGVDTYTLFIQHMVQVGDPRGLQQLLESLAASGFAADQVLLTSLLGAAGQAGNHAAALELFDALIAACMPAGSSSSSSSSSQGLGSSSSTYSSTDLDGALAPQQQQQQQQQQPRQARLALEPKAGMVSSSNSSGGSSTSGASSSSKPSGSQYSSSLGRTAAGPAAVGSNGKLPQPPRQHPQVLPLTATSGPDAVAWNALTAVLVQSDRLSDAAAAVERGVQAAAAAGQAAPPIEGFAALIRGYRNAGIKSRAVAALRRFLSLGGRPGRVMCNDIITLCLRDDDLRTARQVVRAMELTGCLSEADLASYHAWFQRWEARSTAAGVTAAAGSSAASAAAAGGYWGAPGGSSGAAGQAAAVERLKWWLGLPNSYYVDSSGSSSSAARSRDGLPGRQ